MLRKDPWWWPALGVALGFALWVITAMVWLALMAALYGIYAWFGGKALLVAVLIIVAVVLHFQLKDIEEGMSGNVLQNMLVRWLRHRRRKDE